jgi:hypothetical protein
MMKWVMIWSWKRSISYRLWGITLIPKMAPIRAIYLLDSLPLALMTLLREKKKLNKEVTYQ